MSLLIKARLNRLTALDILERRDDNIFADLPERPDRPAPYFATRRAA
ncbi:hypothetical protein [Roseovarius aestuariivivens]|nr:hypothetical protein [Roseovarius aestuariivivens]